MKRRFKRLSILFPLVLACLGFLPGRVQAAYTLAGKVYTASGTSGTAADSPSFATLAAYRWGIAAQIGIQNASPNAPVIYAAAGSSTAYFNSDVVTVGQWTTPEAAGQTILAVAETYPGQVVTPAWSGGSYVEFSKKIITTPDDIAGQSNFPSRNQQLIPQPTALTITAAYVTLAWTGLTDPDSVVTSYSVYRATYVPNAPSFRYGNLEVLAAEATPSSLTTTVTFTDSAVLPNTVYYYTIAPNFDWQGVASSNAGARTNKPYYTTFGQSLTQTVTTPPQVANLVASWQVPAAATQGQIFTILLRVTNTGDIAANSVTPTASPIVTGGGTVQLQGGYPQPITAAVAAHSEKVFTYLYSATGSGTVAFSARADNGVVSSNWVTSAGTIIAAPPSLAVASILAAPPLVFISATGLLPGTVYVTMTVSNTSEVTASHVSPTANPAPQGLGTPTLLANGPAITAVDIPAHKTANFTWAYTALTNGTVLFEAGASGFDPNTGNTVTAAQANSNGVYLVDKGLDHGNWALPFSGTPSTSHFTLGEVITAAVNVDNNTGEDMLSLSGTVKLDQATMARFWSAPLR